MVFINHFPRTLPGPDVGLLVYIMACIMVRIVHCITAPPPGTPVKSITLPSVPVFCFRPFRKSPLYAASAFALTRSIALRIPIQTLRSVKTSTTLPIALNGASCKTERSFIMPLWTMYSTI